MFKEDTIFILGAGSNKEEFDFPLGAGLCEQIRDLFERHGGSVTDFTSTIASEAGSRRMGSLTLEQVIDAADVIYRGIDGKASIDDFIDAHEDKPHVKKLAKMAIAHIILHKEEESGLRPDFDRHIEELRPARAGWYDQFWRILSEGVRATKLQEITDNPVSVITFNYDRSLEQFLCIRLCNTYGCNPTTALEIVRQITILHPYGTVGEFCFSTEPSGNEWKYGDTTHLSKRDGSGSLLVTAVADSLATYSEEARDRASHLAIQKVVSEAKQIYFLGFGYHVPNLKLLYPTSNDVRPHTLEGTAVSISAIACRDISYALSKSFRFAGRNEHPHLFVERRNDQLFSDFSFRMRRT